MVKQEFIVKQGFMDLLGTETFISAELRFKSLYKGLGYLSYTYLVSAE